MTQDEILFITTSDFGLTCALHALGFSIDGIDKNNKNRVKFFFRRTTDLDKTIKDYWSHQMRVDPLEYDRAIREIKAQINTEVSVGR